MVLSVIIPVYNEERTIEKILRAVKRAKLPSGIHREIIVVNDGSTDGTRRFLEMAKGITLINHLVNRGKGAAMKSGIEHSTGDIIITQDADLEYDPEQYSQLISPILKNKAKVVYGSRNLKPNPRSYYLAYWGGRVLTAVANLLYGTRITDESTGYKVIHREVFKKIKIVSSGFEFCPELTAKVALLGYKIYEISISYHPRTFAEGKKINWRDGVLAILTLIKYRIQGYTSVDASKA